MNKDQIKKEFFLRFLKGRHETINGDTIIHGIVNNGFYKKYQYDLSIDEFNRIGDELEESGCVQWNTDEHLALTTKGLEYLNGLNAINARLNFNMSGI